MPLKRTELPQDRRSRTWRGKVAAWVMLLPLAFLNYSCIKEFVAFKSSPVGLTDHVPANPGGGNPAAQPPAAEPFSWGQFAMIALTNVLVLFNYYDRRTVANASKKP